MNSLIIEKRLSFIRCEVVKKCMWSFFFVVEDSTLENSGQIVFFTNHSDGSALSTLSTMFKGKLVLCLAEKTTIGDSEFEVWNSFYIHTLHMRVLHGGIARSFSKLWNTGRKMRHDGDGWILLFSPFSLTMHSLKGVNKYSFWNRSDKWENEKKKNILEDQLYREATQNHHSLSTCTLKRANFLINIPYRKWRNINI